MRFLENVVVSCKNHFGDLSNVLFILPGKRTGTFLKKYILENDNKTQWSPEVLGFSDLAQRYTTLDTIDGITLRFELYKAYTEIKPDAEDFGSFDSWASTILSDYNAIDNYLVDAKKVYNDLRNIKDIEEWSFNLDPLSKDQLQFLDFWTILGKLHEQFRENLLQKELAYPGMLLRNFADQLNQVVPTDKMISICFAGFNAISKAEKKIIQYFQKNHDTLIFWDVDDYYLKLPDHPAGHFTRKLIAELGSSSPISTESRINRPDKSIDIISVPNPLAQSRLIGELIGPADFHSHTAIVLADESLLLPTLESLPMGIEKVNITMGMSSSQSALYKIFNSLISIHIYAIRRKENKHDYSYYHKDFLACLQDIKSHSPSLIKDEDFELIANQIITNNKINIDQNFLNTKDISRALLKIKSVFEPINNQVDVMINALLSFINLILSDTKIDAINKEVAIQFEKILIQFSEVNQRYNYLTNLGGFQQIFRQISSSEKLSFLGEPLGGIQIMGMLETRALDFNKVILLGANEGVLPSARKPNSFFPFELQKYYGIPNYTDHESVYAYYFYRLLQHPSNVTIVHSSERDDFGSGGEKSRFISQLEYEHLTKNLIAKVKNSSLKTKIDSETSNNLSITKSTKIIEHLEKLMANSGVSPSSLEKYLACPLDYYHRYVLGLSEEDELEDEINNAIMGSCIHDTLETLYLPTIGRTLTENVVKNMKSKVSTVLKEEFAKVKLQESIRSGPNHLIFLMAEKMVHKVIDYDLSRISKGVKVKILGLEEDLKATLPVERNGQEFLFKLRGKVDRIEIVNNLVQIIDYKSGRVDTRDVKIAHGNDFTKKTKTLQLGQYMWLYANQEGNKNKQVTAAILSLPKNSENLMCLDHEFIGDGSLLDLFELFEAELKTLIQEILDPELKFEHSDSAKYCVYCRTSED